jgi:PhnB protein
VDPAAREAELMVKAIPEGYHTVTPYLIVEGAAHLIDFMKEAFGAEEGERMLRANGTIGHAEVRIGDSVLMISDANAQWVPMPAAIYLYVPDTDATFRSAIQAGATSVMEPADQFYGDRNAGVRDIAGNVWWIGTHKEDVPRDELERRAAAHMK